MRSHAPAQVVRAGWRCLPPRYVPSQPELGASQLQHDSGDVWVAAAQLGCALSQPVHADQLTSDGGGGESHVGLADPHRVFTTQPASAFIYKP